MSPEVPVVALKGHFDGKVIVPDEPVALPIDQPLIVRVDTIPAGSPAPGVAGADLLRFAGTIDSTDLEQMKTAIDEGCERVEANDW
jgi:hypothetical protein